jgi:hypothetical protein
VQRRERCGVFLGRVSGALIRVSFILFLPWLFTSLFVYSEMGFLLTGYGTSCVPFEVSDLPSSGEFVTSVVLGMSTICHIVQSSSADIIQESKI